MHLSKNCSSYVRIYLNDVACASGASLLNHQVIAKCRAGDDTVHAPSPARSKMST